MFEPGHFLRRTHLSLCPYLYSLLLFHPFHSELLNADVRSTRIAAKGQKKQEGELKGKYKGTEGELKGKYNRHVWETMGNDEEVKKIKGN